MIWWLYVRGWSPLRARRLRVTSGDWYLHSKEMYCLQTPLPSIVLNDWHKDSLTMESAHQQQPLLSQNHPKQPSIKGSFGIGRRTTRRRTLPRNNRLWLFMPQQLLLSLHQQSSTLGLCRNAANATSITMDPARRCIVLTATGRGTLPVSVRHR